MEALICSRVPFFERLQKASRISHSTVGKERIRYERIRVILIGDYLLPSPYIALFFDYFLNLDKSMAVGRLSV